MHDPLRRSLNRITAALLAAAFLLCACGETGPESVLSGEGASAASSAAQQVISIAEKIRSVNEEGEYDPAKFVRDGYYMSYEDERYTSAQGIDVSEYSGEIDWKKVKDAGIGFAFLRIGRRGYTEGGLFEDASFESNYSGASENGIPLGVYFFSQAVNEEEAVEEARFVLDILDGRALKLPVVFDPEDIPHDDARTDGVSGEQFTKNTLAFCAEIEKAGYEPAIYCNAHWQLRVLDMEQLSGITTWYADFTAYPQSSYHFEFWQYTHKGRVDGIADDVDVDMNLRLVPKY